MKSLKMVVSLIMISSFLFMGCDILFFTDEEAEALYQESLKEEIPVSTATTTKKGYGFCLSEKWFDNWVSYSGDGNKQAMIDMMVAGQCGIFKGGDRVTVTDSTWTGKIELNGQIWTYMEAVER